MDMSKIFMLLLAEIPIRTETFNNKRLLYE